MAIPRADTLIKKAREGEKLNHVDRRFCVAYLMATAPDESNVSLAALFAVSEKMIRNDKLFIREEKAKFIKEDDIALVIADVALNFDRQIRDLEAGKRVCGVQKNGKGTRTYLEFCKSIFKLELDKVDALQNLGYYPRNLGTLTKQTFEYKASVSVMEGGAPASKLVAQRADKDGTLDAEFCDSLDTTELKMLPAPSSLAS